MQNLKQIYLADDHVLVRSGLRELIEKIGPFKVTREFDDGRQLVDAYPFDPPPDLIVLDVEMPQMNGKQVMEWFREREISIPVLLLTLTENEAQIIHLFRLGVRGYLHKNCSAVMLRKALDEILSFGYYHDDMMAKALTADDRINRDQVKETLQQLTEKEKEFLRLTCDQAEYTYEQIADMMDVHPRTVNKYREAIFEKFGVRSKTGLVLFAVKNRLVEL